MSNISLRVSLGEEILKPEVEDIATLSRNSTAQ